MFSFSVVTWRHRKRKLVAVRAVAGRAEKGSAVPTAVSHSSSSSIRHHQSAQELHHMCSHSSQPLPLCECGNQQLHATCGCHSEPVCGCGNAGCVHSQQRMVCRQISGPCCSHSATSSIPVTSNTAYEVESQVVLATNPAYTQDRAPPLAPPPPPSYSEVNKVKSIHEYDYISAQNKSQQ